MLMKLGSARRSQPPRTSPGGILGKDVNPDSTPTVQAGAQPATASPPTGTDAYSLDRACLGHGWADRSVAVSEQERSRGGQSRMRRLSILFLLHQVVEANGIFCISRPMEADRPFEIGCQRTDDKNRTSASNGVRKRSPKRDELRS